MDESGLQGFKMESSESFSSEKDQVGGPTKWSGTSNNDEEEYNMPVTVTPTIKWEDNLHHQMNTMAHHVVVERHQRPENMNTTDEDFKSTSNAPIANYPHDVSGSPSLNSSRWPSPVGSESVLSTLSKPTYSPLPLRLHCSEEQTHSPVNNKRLPLGIPSPSPLMSPISITPTVSRIHSPLNESDISSSPRPSTPRSQPFTPPETRELLSFWAIPKIQWHLRHDSKFDVWQCLSSLMEESGFNRSPLQCRNRINNVVAKYKRLEKAGKGFQNFPYYDIVSDVMSLRKVLWSTVCTTTITPAAQKSIEDTGTTSSDEDFLPPINVASTLKTLESPDIGNQFVRTRQTIQHGPVRRTSMKRTLSIDIKPSRDSSGSSESEIESYKMESSASPQLTDGNARKRPRMLPIIPPASSQFSSDRVKLIDEYMEQLLAIERERLEFHRQQGRNSQAWKNLMFLTLQSILPVRGTK